MRELEKAVSSIAKLEKSELDQYEGFSKDIVKILKDRYLASGETPQDMWWRVARSIAEVEKDSEKWTKIFHQMLSERLFVPNTPTLMNAGTEVGNLSACFVLPVEDDMGAIYDAIKKAALIFQSGGGCGFSFSKLRPNGDIVHSTGGKASGPISFMKSFDAMAETVEQGGKRRGAMLGSLNVHHPDILDFITAKREEGVLENFNISVEITDEFMEAVLEGREYELRNPRGGHPADTKNEMVTGTLNARSVFDEIAESAWLNGEPGMLFMDTINDQYVFPYDRPGDEHYIMTTNPCGEQMLEAYDACNLGHINLSKFVSDGKIDWDMLGKVVKIAVRFLDDVIDVARFPLPEIEEKVRKNRRIGLGVMGWHELLLKMEIRYDSDEALELAEDLSRFIYEMAEEASMELGREKGPFPAIHEAKEEVKRTGRRNAVLLTIAPTGTTSMIAGTTYGIEPIHTLDEKKRVLDDDIISNRNPTVAKILKEGDPKDLLVTGPEISPQRHVDMQAAFQSAVDASISKTINLPEEASVDDVKNTILYAWRKGCKGLTLYREGSRSKEPIITGKEKSSSESMATIPERPRVLESRTYREPLGCGRTMYVDITRDKGGLQEAFVRIGKTGGCLKAWAEALSRVTSIYLRAGGDPERIISTLKGIRCPTLRIGKDGSSCPDILGRLIEEEFGSAVHVEFQGDAPECPECGSTNLSRAEGCLVCKDCGWSKC